VWGLILTSPNIFLVWFLGTWTTLTNKDNCLLGRDAMLLGRTLLWCPTWLHGVTSEITFYQSTWRHIPEDSIFIAIAIKTSSCNLPYLYQYQWLFLIIFIQGIH
jgi:hypothetical protein